MKFFIFLASCTLYASQTICEFLAVTANMQTERITPNYHQHIEEQYCIIEGGAYITILNILSPTALQVSRLDRFY